LMWFREIRRWRLNKNYIFTAVVCNHSTTPCTCVFKSGCQLSELYYEMRKIKTELSPKHKFTDTGHIFRWQLIGVDYLLRFTVLRNELLRIWKILISITCTYISPLSLCPDWRSLLRFSVSAGKQ
jgi:hypothetical protein